MLSTQLLTFPDLLGEIEGSWKELVSQSDSATPFQSWEWQSTWWATYSGRKRPCVFAAYEGKDLVGLYPASISRGPWRTLRAIGSGASDYLHPLARSGYEQTVTEAFTEEMLHLPDVDLIDLHQVRETNPLARTLQARFSNDALPLKMRAQATCLVLDLPASFDQYLQTLNKSLRYDVRKLDKDLFTSGRARIEEVTAAELDRGLDVFFETHRRRWRKRGLPGAFVGRSEKFHRQWARQALQNGWLWLSVLSLDGNPVGTIYALNLADRCYYYQAGFDPSASSISPGTLLVGYTIRRALSEGAKQFDFLRGDEPYKRRWKPQHEIRNLRFIAPAKGILGKLGHAWNDAGFNLESRVRARLEGGSLFSSKGT